MQIPGPPPWHSESAQESVFSRGLLGHFYVKLFEIGEPLPDPRYSSVVLRPAALAASGHLLDRILGPSSDFQNHRLHFNKMLR